MHQPINPDVRFIRLTGGDDIISEVILKEDGNWKLLNPFKVVYMVNPETGNLSVNLGPWVFARLCEEQIFDIAEGDVLTITRASESITSFYQETKDAYSEIRQKMDTLDKDDLYQEMTEEMEIWDDDDPSSIGKIKASVDKRKLH